jgi:uncharacterized protein (TIGR02687 family)
MDTTRIQQALNRLFNEQGRRIVFWHDPEREFEVVLPSLVPPGVTPLRLDQVGSFEAKVRLERADPAGRYLLYAPFDEPDFDSDWLLDIRLYSHSFRADRASVILDELGLASQHMRLHIAERRKFFDARERLQKLKPLVRPDDREADLDRKMLAVVVRAEQPECFLIVRTLFHAMGEADEIDLDADPPAWEAVGKFDLEQPFWEMARGQFGYEEENPCLRNLLLRLLLADYAHHFRGVLPRQFQHLLLPPAGASTAVVFLAQWRDSTSRSASYDRLSAAAWNRLGLDPHVSGQEIGHLLDVFTFLEVEKAIARGLRDRVIASADAVNAAEVREIAGRRQDGHWVSGKVAPSVEVPRTALHAVYDALVSAGDFFELKGKYGGGLDHADAAALYHAYESELFRFDQLYRHFCEAADLAQASGWDILKPLRGQVEAAYANWFMPTLAVRWGELLQREGGLLWKWQIDGVPNQHDFYERFVRPWVSEGENRRAFVVVSDAFRYEAAQELTRELNGKYRFQAELKSVLGVLPSYTALGMAALLPHKKLAYKPAGDVLIDDRPTSSLAQRGEILARVGGIAVKAEDLLAMKKEPAREMVRGKQVVYIYHNVIDAAGDSASSEGQTFDAVRKAISELADIVRYVINNLSGYLVLVTADHGFLFHETPPAETDKSTLDEHPAGTVKAKKRYLIGRGLPGHKDVWHGSTKATAGAEAGEGEMEFWVPKGANRFHFAGGARFVHGGAMPQEVVVPLVAVKQVKGRAAQHTKEKEVAVHVLGASHKITAPRHRFEILQTEAVGDRVKPVTLKVAVYEGDEPVTSIETLTFDSPSANIDERKKSVLLSLKERPYDKRKAYRLVLRDAETGLEHQSVDVIIDRAFTDDF